jgi:hypothetical protein
VKGDKNVGDPDSTRTVADEDHKIAFSGYAAFLGIEACGIDGA